MKRPKVLLTNPIDDASVRILEQKTEVTIAPDARPGLGVEVSEAFLRAHPVIEGPAYV